MDYINDIISEVLKLKGQGLVLAFCIGIGYLLKLTPIFPNQFIPHAVILFGTGLNPCIIGRGNVDPEINNPIAHLVLQGFLIGIAAFALHHLVISKIEERIKGFIGKLPVVLIGFLLTGCMTGCTGKLVIAEGADPVIVSAEYTAEMANETLEKFMVYEHRHRAVLWKWNPGIKKFADNVRANKDRWIDSLLNVKNEYKRAKAEASPDTPAKLEALRLSIRTLNASVAEANTYLEKGTP